MNTAIVAPASVYTTSSTFDRILLFILVFSIYFEANLPSINGASTPFLIFAFTLIYLSFSRMNTLVRLFSGKYFFAAIGFAVLCAFMETLHPYPTYDFVFRYVNMILGMFGIAALCRDRKAFDIALIAF